MLDPISQSFVASVIFRGCELIYAAVKRKAGSTPETAQALEHAHGALGRAMAMASSAYAADLYAAGAQSQSPAPVTEEDLTRMWGNLAERPGVQEQMARFLLGGPQAHLDPDLLYTEYLAAGWTAEYLDKDQFTFLLNLVNNMYATVTGRSRINDSALLQEVLSKLTLVASAVEATAQAAAALAAGARETYLRLLVTETGTLPLAGPEKSGADATSQVAPPCLSDVYIGLRAARSGKQPESRAKTALEMFANNPHLLLIGEPGGGKTTFLNHLANCVGRKQLGEEIDLGKALPGLPPQWAELLPVRVILRRLAVWIGESGSKATKLGLLSDYLKAQMANECPGAADAVNQAVASQKALLLLDGWDEVADTDPAMHVIREMLNHLPQAYTGMPMLVTCRIRSYLDHAKLDPTQRPWLLDESRWTRADLLLFDEEQIDAFVAAWYRTPAVQLRWPDWKDRADKLRVGTRRPDLADMARTPLLLTMMAIDHADKGEIPDARSVVYEHVVELLLWTWREVDKRRQDGRESLRDLLALQAQKDIDFRRVLSLVAFEAHEGAEAAGVRAAADIPESTLREAFVCLTPDGQDYTWANSVLRLVKLRAGLLIPAKGDCCTFPHRTFQEYLAACHVCSKSEVATELDGLARKGAYWREVVLLAVNRLVYQGEVDRPMLLVGKLCPQSVPADEADWRAVVTAGECMAEIGAGRLVAGQDKETLRRVRSRLVDILEHERLPVPERLAAGAALAAVGDRRDLTEMVKVPGGKFLYGDKKEPLHEEPFWIRKYPVTVGEYRLFCKARGREMPPAPPWGWIDNHPMVNVSWQDAQVFCEWVAETTKQPFSLPTERQWEKAARGTDGRVFPWGDKWDNRKCANSQGDMDLRSTAPVGAFPSGESPTRCRDMVGNVWEWSGYPALGEGETRQTGRSRVLRGGSFRLGRELRFRCALRSGNRNPDYRNIDRGFRGARTA
ncbi:MAG: SUMF1/EgtB/PvdO family nonheme iron enzyme [Armatimonadetes bacterium]|nr:SUMF1/EgtB/PvdO family nonheme iron enzyme [Armatimonadota bacterium]